MVLVTPVQANGPTGLWTTIDDVSGKAKSVIEIFQRENRLYGKVIKVFPEPGESNDPVCDKCEGDRKNQKVIGMVILQGLEQDGDKWTNGTILDPQNGKTYDCSIWLDEEGNLRVRGYLLFFYRTQKWLPSSGV